MKKKPLIIGASILSAILIALLYAITSGTAVVWLSGPSRLTDVHIVHLYGTIKPRKVGSKYFAIIPLKGEQVLIVQGTLDRRNIRKHLGYVTVGSLQTFFVSVDENGSVHSDELRIP